MPGNCELIVFESGRVYVNSFMLWVNSAAFLTDRDELFKRKTLSGFFISSMQQGNTYMSLYTVFQPVIYRTYAKIGFWHYEGSLNMHQILYSGASSLLTSCHKRLPGRTWVNLFFSNEFKIIRGLVVSFDFWSHIIDATSRFIVKIFPMNDFIIFLFQQGDYHSHTTCL